MGTTPFSICRWERGKAFPSPYFRQKLSEVFAHPLASLGLLPATIPSGREPLLEWVAKPPGVSPATGMAPAVEAEVAEESSEPALCLLPPRPQYLIGRDDALQTLQLALELGPPGQVYAITGMPGIGKSALAAELVHQLARDAGRAPLFPDGIISLSVGGQQGEAGLVAVLNDVLARCVSVPQMDAPRTGQEVARQVQATLGGKRALILLDDLDPAFPLAQARTILLAHRLTRQHTLGSLTLLITSRTAPGPGVAEVHLVLGPLEPSAAVDLLKRLVGQSFSAGEQASVRQLCELVGYVPMAIGWVAQALSLGLSAAFLATHFGQVTQALAQVGGRENCFLQAVEALPADLQARFARLAPLGIIPFRLEDATLMHLPEAFWTAQTHEAPPGQFLNLLALLGTEHSEVWAEQATRSLGSAEPLLAATAADLLHLAKHSLILPDGPGSGHFRLSPMLQAVAADLERQQYEEALALAQEHSGRLPESLWQRVFSALAHAWHSRNHVQVVELSYSLYWTVSRLPARQGEQVLLWGMAASQALHDRFYLVRFLNRLAKLRFYRGDVATAQIAWEEAAALAQPLLRHTVSERVLLLLVPWANLTLLPALQDEVEEAERRVQRLLRQSEEVGSVEEVAAAYNKLAFYGRLSGKVDQAIRANATAETLSRGQDWTPGMLAEIALEQARLAGDYERTRLPLRKLLDAARDPQVEPDILLDQAQYAWSQGQIDEAYFYGLQSLELAQKARTPLMEKRSQELLMRLTR